MNKNFKPTYIFDRIQNIPFELLEKENIKGIFLDIDNTIIDRSGVIAEPVDSWIREAKAHGITICILSNAININKVKKIMTTYEIYGLGYARKPHQKGYKMALSLVNLPKENVIMIGDQIFTDVLGANKFGIKSIYTYPINSNEFIGSRIKRPFEKLILKKICKGDNKK